MSAALLLDPKSLDYVDLCQIARACYCPEEIQHPDGEVRFGFFNFKRVYGMPHAFKRFVEIVAAQLAPVAVCAPDVGAAPLVGALAYHRQLPSIYVRSLPKYYYLSYGSKSAHNEPALFGEFLNQGTEVQIVDDTIHDGRSILEAASLLQNIGLVVASVLCVMNVKRDQSGIQRVRNSGIPDVRALVEAAEVLPNWKTRSDSTT